MTIPLHAELSGKAHRVYRTSTAEGHKRIIARIMAALHGDDADGFGHIGRDDIENTVGGFQNTHTEPVSQLFDGPYR